MKQKTYIDKLIENDRFSEMFNKEYQNLTTEEDSMDRENFIAMILRIMAYSIQDNWELEDIIKDIERVIETHRMVNS